MGLRLFSTEPTTAQLQARAASGMRLARASQRQLQDRMTATLRKELGSSVDEIAVCEGTPDAPFSDGAGR